MPATFTVSNYSSPVRDVVGSGVYSITRTFTYNGASASVSDVIFLCKVKSGTVILDGYVTGTSGSSAGDTVKIGIVGADSAISSAITVSSGGVNRFAAKLPYTPTLSSDAEGELSVPIILTRVSGTSTVTGIYTVTLFCQSGARQP